MPVVPTTATPVSSTVNAVSNTVNSATTSVGAAASTATSSTTGVVGSVTALVNSAVSEVGSLFSSTVGGVAGAVESSVSSLFSDSSTSSQTASNTSTVVPDRVASAVKSGVPKSTVFAMNPIASQSDPVKLKGQTSAIATTVSDITGTLTSLEKRFATTLQGGISAVTGELKSLYTNSGAASVVTDLNGAVTSVITLKNSLLGGIASVERGASSIISAGLSDYRSLVGGLAAAITGSTGGLDAFYNGSLPSVTDPNGNPLPGIPSDTPVSVLSSLAQGIKTIGCDISNFQYTEYGAKQSMLGALLGLSAQLDITDAIKAITNCNRFDSSMMNIGQNLFHSKVGTNPNTANTLLTALNPSSVSLSDAQKTAMVTNPNLTTSDTASVQAISTTLNLSASDLYGTGTTVNGSTIWNPDTISGSPNYLVEALTGDSSLSTMVGGSVLDTSNDWLLP